MAQQDILGEQANGRAISGYVLSGGCGAVTKVVESECPVVQRIGRSELANLLVEWCSVRRPSESVKLVRARHSS